MDIFNIKMFVHGFQTIDCHVDTVSERCMGKVAWLHIPNVPLWHLLDLKPTLENRELQDAWLWRSRKICQHIWNLKKNHVLGIAQPFLNSIHLRVFILIFQSFARKENLSDRFKQVQDLLSRVTKCSWHRLTFY